MEIKEKIQEIIKKPVKERENWEHHILIKMKFGGSVRNYLLSMGEFKETKWITHTIKECFEAEFHGIDCLEKEDEYGFEGCYMDNLEHPDLRPAHRIWIKKLYAEKLFKLFSSQFGGEKLK